MEVTGKKNRFAGGFDLWQETSPRVSNSGKDNRHDFNILIYFFLKV